MYAKETLAKQEYFHKKKNLFLKKLKDKLVNF